MNKTPQAVYLPIDKLRPFDGHPFQVKDDGEMEQLVWSILTQGVMTPLVVRPLENGDYEVISGHRRLHACQKAGIETVPALIYFLDRDATAIALVDSNLHRERLLPSEKAFAYKLKLEALKHQGQACGQVGHKSRDMLSDDESGRQVQRYIRLTHLLPELLHMVDEGKISLTPAVELSYLTEREQQFLLEEMEINDCTPSLSQACRLKKHSQAGTLTREVIMVMMQEEKANQREVFKLPMEKVRQFAPKANPKQLEEFVLKACEHYRKHLARQREHER